jgi:hypothetical protein
MSDTITVTFGGREVVLRQVASHCWDHPDLVMSNRDDDFAPDIAWEATPKRNGEEWIECQSYGPTPQAAVTAVESKLRELVRSINEVLGE